jgi:predicted Rossmann fold nucleotide-binding protein DprA/Smf involved in DNA uptake
MEKRVARDLGETLRDEMIIKDAISVELQAGPLTIPELAECLKLPSAEIVRILMAMRRYGSIEELPKSRKEDYYKYQFKQDE